MTQHLKRQKSQKIIMLPWIPKITPRLKRVYKKVGYDVAFKFGKDLGSILSLKNKAKLPKKSYPGVYQIPCSCGITPYCGQTKKRIDTRLGENWTKVDKEEVENTLHSKNCPGEIQFDVASTVAVIHNEFTRKVRETMETRKHDCHHSLGGMNRDKGPYVTATFCIPLMKYLKKSHIWHHITVVSKICRKFDMKSL